MKNIKNNLLIIFIISLCVFIEPIKTWNFYQFEEMAREPSQGGNKTTNSFYICNKISDHWSQDITFCMKKKKKKDISCESCWSLAKVNEEILEISWRFYTLLRLTDKWFYY